ncbi:G2/M phase-specific E3 ubiquitin-protein ligase [Amphibalanus amphitrite]|uniref:G2/M phase-specific E3 ubiquitin-protein ligase n=1 Tax=Amphibalanus amphitrite TaxID=1232801 RepID=A0A6A4X595_AMPAM|nr:G2/M phase-specific E3 ubiquitin-protein ligase [Amphibalanus amphitrite]
MVRFIVECASLPSLFSPNLAQNGKDDEGAEGFLAVDIRKEIVRSGSTVNNSSSDQAARQVSCSRAARSFCEEHRPRQNVVGRELGESCGICLERTDPEDDHNVLWTPCCRHFFHRACLQRMAYHFGYFFYCPGCRNKDNVSGFLKHMRHFGIFIPKRDASWEMVPNAFGELLERHLVCDVRYCLCSQGRSHQENDTDSPWRLCVCGTCGSAGTHLACSDLDESVTVWSCPSCTLEPAPANKKSTLREFIASRAPPGAGAPPPLPQTGEGSSSGPAAPPAPLLTAALSLHEVLAQLDEPERLIKFTVNPLSGLSVQTRPVSGARLAAREPGRRPVAFSAEDLLPEAVVSVQDVAQAELRLWSENHVAAAEAGGQSTYSAARRRDATAVDDAARPLAAAPADGPPRWAARAAASNAAPRPTASERQRLQLAGLPPLAELRAALSALQCPGCRADFRLLSELTYHYQSHSGEALFYCRICQQPTSQWGSFHLLDHHPDLRAEEWASYVDSTFQQAQALMVRLLLHRRNIKVTLDQGRTIARNFKVIMASSADQAGQSSAPAAAPAGERSSSAPDAAEVADFVCDECGAVLRTHSAIASHQFLHSAAARDKYAGRPHHCADCHFGSGQLYLVTRHRTLHHRRTQGTLPGPAAAAVTAATAAPAPRPASAVARTPSPAPPVAKSSVAPLPAGPLPVTRMPSQSVMASAVSDSEVAATALSGGKYRCPHCRKVTRTPFLMKAHLYWHSAEAERLQRPMAYHCPFCYFAANRSQRVARHISSVHNRPYQTFQRACPSCRRFMYSPQRHNCLPEKEKVKKSTSLAMRTSRSIKSSAISRPKLVRHPAPSFALTMSGDKMAMPAPIPLTASTSKDADHRCKLCGKEGTKECVRVHMKFHTAQYERLGRQRPFHCHLCFFSNTNQNLMCKHMVVTHNLDPASCQTLCTICNEMVFNVKAHARYHRQQGDGPAATQSPVKIEPELLHRAVVKTEPGEECASEEPEVAGASGEPGEAEGSGRVVSAGCLIACGNAQSRLDCPFCDAFFDSKRMYDRHMMLSHLVGAETRHVVCRFRFCCAESTPTHDKLFHKGSEDRSFRCSQCDSTYTCAEDLRVHTTRQHADESVPAFELREDGHCWCSNLRCGGELGNIKHHLIAYHSVLVRGFPGPRAAPYTCPKCPLKLEYHKLIEHMQQSHGWAFSPGVEYRSPVHVRDMEVGCPLCYRTFSFECLFMHMQENHQWTFLDSRAGARERKTQPSPRKPSTTVALAGKLVKQAAGRHLTSSAAADRAGASGSSSAASAAVSGCTIYDCAFCDAFFSNEHDYMMHGRKNHAGLKSSNHQNPEGLCWARYCYLANDRRHTHVYHKNLTKRTVGCRKCDGVFTSKGYLREHMKKMHSVTHPVRTLMGKAVCSCDLSKTRSSLEHLCTHHFPSYRSPPGARPQPYRCFECGVSMRYEELKAHLTADHSWRLKESGTDLAKVNAKVYRSRGLLPPLDSVSSPAAASRAVASLPRSVSVTALPPANPRPPALVPQLDAARAFSGRHRISELIDDPARLDCPFCDAFFLALNRYMRHMRLAHSGSNGITDSTCTFRYCYNMSSPATTEKHIATFHKGAAALEHKCSFCDRMGRSERSIGVHAEISHKSQMQLGVQVGDGAECVCDAVGSECESNKSLLWMHFVHNHSVQVRSYPGPRSRPYDCPVCLEKLPFRELVDHLSTTHMWRIKTDGEEAFGVNRIDNRNFLDSITVMQVTGGAGAEPPVLTPAVAGSSSSVPRKKATAKPADGVTEAMAAIIACPFCDDFFDIPTEYEEHALINHSGLNRPESMCPVKYCCAPSGARHLAFFHKGLLPLHCRSCDASFRTNNRRNKHIVRTHKWIVNRSTAKNPLYRMCSCSVKSVGGIHMHACHSVAVRGVPGPRDEPYLCPVAQCDLQLTFERLVAHLTEEHHWQLKLQGQNPFTGSPPKAAKSTVFKAGPANRPTVPGFQALKVRQTSAVRHAKMVFRCHYCPMSGARDKVRIHQNTVHRQAHGAFMQFARSCDNRSGLYLCPFCPFKNKRLWSFHLHLVRSAACRQQLGPSAEPWLERSDTDPSADPTAAETAPRVAPLKIKLRTTDSGTRTGSVGASPSGGARPATRPAPARRKTPPMNSLGPMAGQFWCHFCLIRGQRGEMKVHMIEKHGEAYHAFLAFANQNTRTTHGGRRGYSCPGCFEHFDKTWLLMPHVANSSCRDRVGAEQQVWISQCPPIQDNMYGGDKRPGRMKIFAAVEDPPAASDSEQPTASPAEADPLQLSDDEADEPRPVLPGQAAAPADGGERPPAGAGRSAASDEGERPAPAPDRPSSAGTTAVNPPAAPAPARRKTSPKRRPGTMAGQFWCHFCLIRGQRKQMREHMMNEHGEAYYAYLAFAKQTLQRLASGRQRHVCPGCSRQFDETWLMMPHVAHSSCRDRVGAEQHVWISQCPPMDENMYAHYRKRQRSKIGAAVEDPTAASDSEQPTASPAEEDPLQLSDDEADEPRYVLPGRAAAPADGGERPPAGAGRSAASDEGERPAPAPDRPSSAGTTAVNPPAAPAATASVQSSQTFECLKCSARFSDKALLIAHSQSQHSTRKKRTLTPDKTQPRIDSFFKRAKLD